MSNLETEPQELRCGSEAEPPVWSVLEGRDVVLGGTRAMGTNGLHVSRTLPNRDHRMVGAWCFVDHFGPADGAGMRIPPHPHTALQTVTWLLDGEVHHRDSLGSSQLITPGQLNLMTAGRGIAHSEVSRQSQPLHGSRPLHGVQLWVALPDSSRAVDPDFEHHPALPSAPGITVLMGTLAGLTSPARTYSALVAAELTLTEPLRLSLEESFEYAVLALDGSASAGGKMLPSAMVYFGRGRSELGLAPADDQPARLLLLGGEPFTEEIVMWWNFVGRTHDDIVAARDDWMAGRRFGPVPGYDGDALPAPQLPATPLKPRPAHRAPHAR